MPKSDKMTKTPQSHIEKQNSVVMKKIFVSDFVVTSNWRRQKTHQKFRDKIETLAVKTSLFSEICHFAENTTIHSQFHIFGLYKLVIY